MKIFLQHISTTAYHTLHYHSSLQFFRMLKENKKEKREKESGVLIGSEQS